MNNIQRTKEATQSPNNKANAKPDGKANTKANAKSSTHDQEIEKMVTDTVDTVEKATPSEISEVKVYIHEQINASKTELKGEIKDVRTEIKDVKTELKAEISDVRTEVKDLRTEIGAKIDTFQGRALKILVGVMGIVVTILLAVISLLAKTML